MKNAVKTLLFIVALVLTQSSDAQDCNNVYNLNYGSKKEYRTWEQAAIAELLTLVYRENAGQESDTCVWEFFGYILDEDTKALNKNGRKRKDRTDNISWLAIVKLIQEGIFSPAADELAEKFYLQEMVRKYRDFMKQIVQNQQEKNARELDIIGRTMFFFQRNRVALEKDSFLLNEMNVFVDTLSFLEKEGLLCDTCYEKATIVLTFTIQEANDFIYQLDQFYLCLEYNQFYMLSSFLNRLGEVPKNSSCTTNFVTGMQTVESGADLQGVLLEYKRCLNKE